MFAISIDGVANSAVAVFVTATGVVVGLVIEISVVDEIIDVVVVVIVGGGSGGSGNSVTFVGAFVSADIVALVLVVDDDIDGLIAFAGVVIVDGGSSSDDAVFVEAVNIVLELAVEMTAVDGLIAVLIVAVVAFDVVVVVAGRGGVGVVRSAAFVGTVVAADTVAVLAVFLSGKGKKIVHL